LAFTDQRTNASLAEGKGVVGAEHHTLSPHHFDQELERALLEYRGVHINAVEIVTRRKLRDATGDRMMPPGVFQAAEQEGETSAAMGEADA
jgi:hypothetical protein